MVSRVKNLREVIVGTYVLNAALLCSRRRFSTGDNPKGIMVRIWTKSGRKNEVQRTGNRGLGASRFDLDALLRGLVT